MAFAPSSNQTTAMSQSSASPRATQGNLWGVITPATPTITPILGSKRKYSYAVEEKNRDEGPTPPKIKKQTACILVYGKGKTPDVFCSHLLRYFTSCSEETAVHGVRYLMERRSIVEKLFWIITIILSLVAMVLMVDYVNNKFKSGALIVNFASEHTPLYEISFPAVTICPETKIDSERFKVSAAIKSVYNGVKLTPYEYNVWQYFSILCDHLSKKLPGGEDFIEDPEKMIVAFREIGVAFKDSFLRCSWGNNLVNCSDIFTPVLTREGICYSFNIIDRSELYRDHVYIPDGFQSTIKSTPGWLNDMAFSRSDGLNTYPRRALYSGADNGLKIVLQAHQKHEEMMCKSFKQGYRISLDNPLDVPSVSKRYFRVQMDQFTTAGIDPRFVYSQPKLKKFSTAKRRCYLDNERQLQHFKLYTQANCFIECKTNFTLKKCDCVGFQMPRNKSTKVCGPAKLDCMNEAEVEMETNELNRELQLLLENEETPNSFKIEPCQCLQLCIDLSFDVETSMSAWDWKTYDKTALTGLSDHSTAQLSTVAIYFKSQHFIKLMRNELYGWPDMIANFGGLLSLFTGVSLISIMEIMYYMTLRFLYNERLYGVWSAERRQVPFDR